MNEFRAWDKSYKKMIYTDFVGKSKLAVTFEGQVFSYTDWNAVNYDDEKMIHTANYVDRFELMQYTGMTDKNEVKIFDSDIVSETVTGQIMWDGDAVCIQPAIGQVIWNKYGWNVQEIQKGKARMIHKMHLGDVGDIIDFSLSKYEGDFYGWDTCEVIGNIHQRKQNNED